MKNQDFTTDKNYTTIPNMVTDFKELIVNGRALLYRVSTYVGEYGMSEYTEFYEGFEEITRKKYYLFGPVITITKPKFAFRLPYSIESDKYSKTSVRRNIESYVELLGRKAEIERGEII
jgi:hypothetical protein